MSIKPIIKEEQCPNNEWVRCKKKDKCSKCGWNPEVSKERLKAGK